MIAEPLSIADVIALGVLCDAAARGAHVRWLHDETGDVVEGTARAIAHDGGGFMRMGEDVRDMYLHVSTAFEHWLPIRELMGKVTRGEFAAD